MQYHFTEADGSQTPVEPERWQWGVVYSDGTELLQFESDGSFHRIGEVEQDRVTLFALYKPTDPTRRIDIPVRPGMRLIHKYVNVRPAGMESFVRVYCVGYRMDGAAHFTYVLPDDRIIESAADDVDLTRFAIV
jgi:hypothetical protein